MTCESQRGLDLPSVPRRKKERPGFKDEELIGKSEEGFVQTKFTMAAVQCDNFVGNAWKKDLCLNCYRSKEEHHTRHDCFQAVIQTRIPDPPKEGILKRAKTKKGTNKVIFLNTECEVIGFGGDDSYSDEDYPDFSLNQTDEVDDGFEESEEDKAFQKLTKTNTDYNSIAENLQEPKEGEVKKIIEPLKLGKQVFDDKGNKKTLLVSVTPFGNQQSPVTAKNRINANGFLSKSTTMTTTTTTVASAQPKVNGHTDSVVKIEKKATEPAKTEAMSNGCGETGKIVQVGQSNLEAEAEEDVSSRGTNDKGLIKRSQPLDKNFKFRLIKTINRENDKTTEISEKEEKEGVNVRLRASDKVSNLLDKAKEKVNQFPVIADNSNFKFKTKVLTNGRKSCTETNNSSNNKAVVLDIYNIERERREREEEVKTTNQINEEKSSSMGLLTSSEIRAKFLSPDVREPEVNSESDKKIQMTPTAVERTRLIPNVSSLYRHHLKSVPGTKKKEEDDGKPLTNGVVSSMTLVPNIECTFRENNGSDVSQESDKIDDVKKEKEEEKGEDDDEDNESPTKEIEFKKISIENFDNILKGEEIILFSMEKGKTDKEEESSGGLGGDSDEKESVSSSGSSSVPPALPTKPPPPLFESRSSFLQELTVDGDGGFRTGPEKPKVPAKPILIQSRRTNFQSPVHTNRARSPSMEKFLDATTTPAPPSTPKSHPPLQETLSTDSGKNQKRPAPKPPSPNEDSSERIVTVLNDKEGEDQGPKPEVETSEETTFKRISKSTDNLLEFITDPEDKSQLVMQGLEEVVEPVALRTLSLSQDNLMPCEVSDGHSKKKLSRGKFFLQKLLHLGKGKEGSKDLNQCPRGRGSTPSSASKPKPEIIHPSDLNGSRVEVVPPARSFKSRRTSSSASSSSGEHRESDVLSDSSASHSVSSSGNDSYSTNDQTKKPPPPPRAHSLDTWNAKPARPPPPKSIDLLRQNNTSWCNVGDTNKSDNHYVNLGEARSGLTPNKPVRTGSLREVAMDSVRRVVTVPTQPEDSDYESFIVSSASPVEDNLYECVQSANHRSSLPECDSLSSECPNSTYQKGKRSAVGRDAMHRRSEGNVDLNSDCFKMKFLRSVSLPYCASETESEIYSPYSFYGSELGEEDYEATTSNHILRMSRLKLKKGRSIVHKNLEDNYGAVVVANHEALAQVVEQMRQGPAISPPLRALTTAVNLRWTDFVIVKDAAGVVVERRVFYPALWGVHNVTLSLMAEQGLNSSLHAKGPFNLNPIAELNDLVPASYLPMLKKGSSELIQASISVLTRLQIETVESYGRTMRSGVHTDESKKEVNFVLLQIINAFKSLQAQGIEEVSKNLANLAVCREEKDPHPRICITDSFERSENRESLCRCLIHAIKEILPPTDLTPLLSSVLYREKAVSLSQAKGILEFVLWGPADIAFGNSNRERESALQRWLDLERATVLHGLVRTRAELTVFEEWQLLFLVRTSAKIMAEASLLLENGIGDDPTCTP